jgi:hypothetical protein
MKLSEWNLLGGYGLEGAERRDRMVAGECNAPNALLIPYRLELVH